MICFVIAFPAEAMPILQHYGFKTFKPGPFPIYKSEIGFLVISGMGKKSAAKAVSHLAELCPENAIWMNVGIGGHQNAEIGAAFLAHKVVDLETGKNWYPQILFSAKCKSGTVFTVEKCETQYGEDGIYDMEASGFYEEAARFSTAELIHSFKIISDNAASPGAKVSPKIGEALIEKKMKTLDQIANELIVIQKELPTNEPELMKEFLERWHFTVTQQHQLRKKLLKLQTLDPKSSFLSKVKKCINSRQALAALEVYLEALPIYL